MGGEEIQWGIVIETRLAGAVGGVVETLNKAIAGGRGGEIQLGAGRLFKTLVLG